MENCTVYKSLSTPIVTSVNKLCKMKITTGKKCIVRKRVPNPIPIRVVTLPSTHVRDCNRQKLRFPEISKTNQAMSM